MADVIFPNFALNSANDAFSAIWKLTRALKKAGWLYKASGDGSAKDATGVAASDKWGGNADPSADAYIAGLDTVAAWWCAQGPTVLKVSMTAAPTGQFLRSEKVTQATSGAEGELVGYDYDGSTTGHAVILPRVGTFDNSHVITGAISGATFTATALETYVSEVVFYKSTNTTTGSIFMQRVSNENENASRFSVLAANVNCTATVAPGASATAGNTFPAAGSYVAKGDMHTAGTPNHSNWLGVTTNLGKSQIVATNVTAATGVSADGTFWIMIGDTSSSTQAQFFGYFRCDDSEDGDLDPFVFCHPSSTSYNDANVRTISVGAGLTTSGGILTNLGTSISWRGWRRRGWATSDAFIPLASMQPGMGTGMASYLGDTNANPDTVACSYTTKRVREKIPLVSADNTKKIRKGSPRWMWQLQGNTTFDTLDTKLKVILAPFTAASYGSIALGPYDGASTPAQS